MWLMKLPKNFEKLAILKIGELVSFWGFKTYFGILPLKWYILGMEKIDFHKYFPVIVIDLTKYSLYYL